jgi:SAM-dependent methyltransferase
MPTEAGLADAPSVQRRAEALSDRIFLGGPVEDFERVGRQQLVTLIHDGLRPQSSVLDVGCGCLRGGYWLIHFLGPGRYFAIEPNRDMVEAGLSHILERGLADEKRPSFAHNDDWDFSVFGVGFDYVVARSIWTHASKRDISAMLDSFVAVAAPGAKLFASYLPAGWGRRDYRGTGWVGRSHRQDEPGLVHHSKRWLAAECRNRGLGVEELRDGVINRQRWLRITAE